MAFFKKTDTLFLTTKLWRSLQQRRRLPFSPMREVEPSVLKKTRLIKTPALAVLLSSQTEEEVKKMKNDELKDVVRFKKRKGDDAMPKMKTDLINRYNATVARSDLLLGAYLIDVGHEIINGVMV